MVATQTYVMRKSSLPAYLKALGQKTKREVVAPQTNETGATVFDALAPGAQPYIKTITDFSPQKYFQPARERLFEFSRTGKGLAGNGAAGPTVKGLAVKETLDSQKRVIFGVRACDTHAIDMLDRLFLEFYGRDRYYQKRKQNNLVIALRCGKPCKNGFCASMGTGEPVNHDLLFVESGKNYSVEIASEPGKTAIIKKFMKPSTRKIPKQKAVRCRKKLGLHRLTQNLNASRKHPVWAKNAKTCLSCSSCTMVCPACYCFYIEDVFSPNPALAERCRNWDSCQLKRFSRIAGNHYFRRSREARLKQWLFHKFSYFPEHHGSFGCSGCGRCINACPVGIDLTEILNAAQKTAKGSKGRGAVSTGQRGTKGITAKRAAKRGAGGNAKRRGKK